MGVDGICAKENALVDLVQIVPHFRDNGIVSPDVGILLIPVPGKPTGPGFEGGVSAYGPVVAEREF